MKPAPFDYVAPVSLDEAVSALASGAGDAKVLAGGQSLIPMMALRLARPATLVDINRLPGLDGLREASGMLEIGALVRQRALERWAVSRSPLFAEVLRHVAHPPIRNRGTIVGNVVHADPASELPALLLCLEGVVVARGPRGERMIPLLLQNKGDQRPYAGGGLGKETAAWAFMIPKEGKPLRKSDPPVITVEIASLYLISAIYYGRLDFAEGPVLVNRTKSAGERKLLNNDNRQMKRVYDTYADWVKKVKAEGLDALRQRNEPPLAGTRFGWW